jgi:FtsH-binding integral membrane protein
MEMIFQLLSFILAILWIALALFILLSSFVAFTNGDFSSFRVYLILLIIALAPLEFLTRKAHQ